MSDNTKSVVSIGGTSFFNLLFVGFLVLKLTKVINWSWWWVTAPLWGQIVLTLALIIIILIVYAILKFINSCKSIK